MTSQTFQQGPLILCLRDDPGAISLLWSGKSTEREPGKFIVNVLMKAADLSAERRQPLVLDFQDVGYMNSSTITPIIRLLQKAKRASSSVRVVYRKELKWQALSFSALEVFQTTDHRIEIRGV